MENKQLLIKKTKIMKEEKKEEISKICNSINEFLFDMNIKLNFKKERDFHALYICTLLKNLVPENIHVTWKN
jgi:hypothetical protein